MYTILAVDDAKDTLMLLEQDLLAAGYKVLTANSGEAALVQLETFSIDMVLLDMYMPGMTGLEVLQKTKIQEKMTHIPIIMLSSSDDEDQFVAALEYGADDFVTKPYIAKVLLARIRNSFRLMEKTQELEQLAKIDFLTGVNNRGSFEKLVYGTINQCRRMDQNIVIVIFDLDHFKNINDTYGHSAGDKVLIEFSKLLLVCFREYDVIGRVGGEEFGVCLPNTDMNDAVYACDRLRAKLATKSFDFEGEHANEVKISVSAGLASAKGEDINYEKLFRKADCALYKAKNSGRNKILYDCVDVDTDESICPQKAMEHCEAEGQIEASIFKTEPELKPEQEKEPETKVEATMLDNTNDDIFTEHNSQEKYPGIDYEIGVGNVLGDDELFSEILLMFIEDHGNDAQKLEKSIQEGDYATLKSVIHTLKGVACSVGAMELFEVARELDVAVNEKIEAQYQELFTPVAASLTKVMNGIKAQQG